MQSKKRAKPVKFGEKNKTEQKSVNSSQKETEKNKKENEELEQNQDDIVDEKNIEKPAETEHGAHGLEAHISRTTETIDIKEISDDSEDKNNEDEGGEDKKEELIDMAPEDGKGAVKDDVPNESSDVVNEVAEDAKSSDDAEGSEADESGNDEDSSNDEIVEDDSTNIDLINKDGAFFNRPPDEYDKKKSSLPYFIMIVVITFILGVIFFSGIYYAVSNKSITLPGSKNSADVTEAPVIEVPTKKPVDLAQYTIQVLNGTGTAGVAAKLKEELTTEGFKVGSVGNAESDDFEKTEISAAKKVNKEYLDKLKETLGETYMIAEVTELSTGSADVVVTIGSETAE